MSNQRERLSETATELRVQVGGKLDELWSWMLIRGLLAIAVGLVALLWPQPTLALMFRVLGAFCLLDGITSLVGAFKADRERDSSLLAACISLVVGAVLLFWPDATIRTLMIVLGVFALLQGMNMFRAGRGLDPSDPGRGTWTAIGVASAIIGVVLIVWPGSGAIAVSWLVAILAFLAGGVLLWLASRLKAVESRVASRANGER